MKEKEVVLIRKQSTPFTVNYPIDGRLKKYVWNGTKGNLLNKKAVPFEVYDWLAQYTLTFTNGCLIIDESDDEEINEIKENIDNVDLVEKVVLTKNEIEKILTTGNHLVLKKELNQLTEDLPEELAEKQKRYFIITASEIGVDSSAKRKIISEWAGIDFETSDLVLDKELREMYEED